MLKINQAPPAADSFVIFRLLGDIFFPNVQPLESRRLRGLLFYKQTEYLYVNHFEHIIEQRTARVSVSAGKTMFGVIAIQKSDLLLCAHSNFNS